MIKIKTTNTEEDYIVDIEIKIDARHAVVAAVAMVTIMVIIFL